MVGVFFIEGAQTDELVNQLWWCLGGDRPKCRHFAGQLASTDGLGGLWDGKDDPLESSVDGVGSQLG